MKPEIQNSFNGNLEHVEHLVALYETVTAGSGRRPVNTSDILRSAVVSLHATLEVFLRRFLKGILATDELNNVEFIFTSTPEEDAAVSIPTSAA